MTAARITLRQARPGDMLPCARVFRTTATDLTRRLSTHPPQVPAADMAFALAHLQRTDPKGFHVAVRKGKVVGFASTIVRGNTHFLAMFWVLPTLQSQGIGRRLLTRAFEHPRPPAGAVRCVFASLDLRAQVLYLKFGMFPRGSFFMLKGAPKPSPRPRFRVELEPIGEVGKTSRRMLELAARFDRSFRGTRRDQDIRYVMSLPGARFYAVRAGRKTVGYAVLNQKGRVGPAGVADPRYSAGLAWAITETARERGVETLLIQVPGVNRGALETFFAAGLKTDFFGSWMTARPVGSFDAYLLAGGMLL
jgi:ribosomal protein S18 acetylase RimI-like enzyme